MSENVEVDDWPDHFPDDCPPPDAIDLMHEVFYLVSCDPPVSEDFLSAAERGVFVGKPECLRAALSCGLTIAYMNRLRDNIPRLKSMKIAKAELSDEHGKLKQTGNPGHHSMWLRKWALATAPELFRTDE